MIPPEIVPSIPKPEATPPMRWEWEPMARFTTFPGEEPDVWPVLEPNNQLHAAWLVSFILAVFAFWLWRWKRDQLRIEEDN